MAGVAQVRSGNGSRGLPHLRRGLGQGVVECVSVNKLDEILGR